MTSKSINNKEQERIDILEDILLRLHHGATPESVQEDFNKHFTGVSAVEISMMEHQLMYGDSEITFEDVLKLCNVHANLFKGNVEEGETADIDHPGHPVRIFKDENHALRAALLRIHNLLENMAEMTTEELEDGMIKGLKRQYDLIGQFDRHYERKEKVFFPLMEKYGHDAPPKVMWGKDDEIRDLFKVAYQKMEKLPEISFKEVTDAFTDFQYEFNEMIFKEEAILLNILLEVLSVEDWYQIAQESDPYGYAIIRPNETWEPKLAEPVTDNSSSELDYVREQPTQTVAKIETKKIELEGGYLTVAWEPKEQKYEESINQPLNPLIPFAIGDGYLNLDQINLMLAYAPVEVAVINSADIVIYSNYRSDWEENFNTRTFNPLGRSLETIYPKKLFRQVESIVHNFRNTTSDKTHIYYAEDGNQQFIEFTVLRDSNNQYAGFIEVIHDLSYFHSIKSQSKRKLVPIEDVKLKDIRLAKAPSLSTPAPINHPAISQDLEAHKIRFADGELMVSWETLQNSSLIDPNDFNRDIAIPLNGGNLSLEVIHKVLNAMPFEITFVDENNKFYYYNNIVTYEDMIFKRTPAQVGRNLELCHPPYLWPMVSELVDDLRHKRRHTEQLWYKTQQGEFVHIFYQAMYDTAGNYRGILETVQNIQPLLDLSQQ